VVAGDVKGFQVVVDAYASWYVGQQVVGENECFDLAVAVFLVVQELPVNALLVQLQVG